MPVTFSNLTGDGVTVAQVKTSVELPDSGTSVSICGTVTPVAGSPIAVTGSPLTMPAIPGSGTTYWNIQVDVTTGAATVQQSGTADPAPINGNNVVVFRQQLVAGAGAPDLDPGGQDTTPDTW
jgi:hypothetical protein